MTEGNGDTEDDDRMGDPRGGLFRNPMATALIGALLVSALLVLAVLTTWRSVGTPAPAPVQATALAAVDVPTPTPRAIRRSTPAPPTSDEPVPTLPAEGVSEASATTPPPSEEPTEPTPAAETPAVPPTAPVEVVMPTIEDGLSTPAPTEAAATASAPLAEFADAAALAGLASGSWQVNDDQIVYTGQGGNAEQWLAIPGAAPQGDFAIEVDARVKDVNPGFCNQSFGLVAGANGGTVWGGGLIWPCDSEQPAARITDATAWQDGYDQDQTLAREPYTPGNSWHTYRLEVTGGDVRLLIDGQELLKADGVRDDLQRAAVGQVGIWSQGVQLAVRRVAVFQATTP